MSLLARQSLQNLERSYSESAVEAPALASQPMTWVGTAVGVAGVPLLIGAGEIEEIVETPAVTPIPGTKPWVMGVASHMGGLLPIISGDVLFRGRAHVGRVRDFCMVIRRPGFHFGMTLSEVERDVKFPLEQRDMDQAVDADFAEYALGGFHYRDRFLAILDIDKLVAQSDLADAAATGPEVNEGKTDEYK